MKGLGNYRFAEQVERKPGVLMFYRGSKAVVRFHDGQSYSLPAQPLRRLDMKPDERFVMLVTRRGKAVTEVRIERPPKARPALSRGAMPKVVVRDGKKLVTRKTPPGA